MIEISHNQARYLIREAEDRRLPDEQWAALQVHLERCAECRAYRARMSALTRSVKRVLVQRWGTAGGPAPDTPIRVQAQRASRAVRTRRTVFALLGLLLVAAVFAMPLRARILAPIPGATFTPTAALPSLTPTVVDRFKGLIAFESDQTGSSEVFLLQVSGSSKPDLMNLTNHPAQDTDPIWSPDGDWLAFLSDRSGKRELYVISVAGTRLTQLTDDPNMDWQGPLSWSADGEWIALTGRRLAQNRDRWGYLVSLTGMDPVSLPGTRSMSGALRFAPTHPLLASPGSIFNIEDGWTFDGWYGLATEEIIFEPARTAPAQASFDWAMGAGGLAYLATSNDSMMYSSPRFDQIRLSPVIGLNNRDALADESGQIIDRIVGGMSFRSLSYMPGGPFLATLQDARLTGCWNVHLVSAFHYNLLEPIDFDGLCVDSDLERASWSTIGPNNAGRWLAVTGRLQDPVTGAPSGEPGIYVARYPPWATGYYAQPDLDRLLDLPPGFKTVPRVRPTGNSLKIDPRAARPVAEVIPPEAMNLPFIEGMLVASQDAPSSAESSIQIFHADGSVETLVQGQDHYACPVWSVNGKKITFAAAPSDQLRGIYWMNADGRHQSLLLPRPSERAGAVSPSYGCPVWSPDGQFIAALRHEGDLTRLALFKPETLTLGHFPMLSPSKLARPVWSPDGRAVYMPESWSWGNPGSTYVSSIYWETVSGPITLQVLTGWDDMQAVSISPDGQHMVAIGIRHPSADQAASASLMLIDMPLPGAAKYITLPNYAQRGMGLPGRIEWLPDGRVLLALPGGPLDHHKATFVAYDTVYGMFTTLAGSEDALLDWAYTDGWVVYSSESGLWAQDLFSDAPPIRLSRRYISSLDLK